MNLTFPHVNVSPLKFFISVFIGIAPWNFFSCSAGAILRELTDTKEIMNKEKYLLVIIIYLVNRASFMFLNNSSSKKLL